MRYIETITDSEFSQMLNWSNTYCDRLGGMYKYHRAKCILLLGFDAGLRSSEIVGIKWNDFAVDIENAFALTVPADVGKYGLSRTIPLSNRLKSSLSEWKYTLEQLGLYEWLGHVIVNTSNGDALTDRQLRRIVATISECSIHRPIHPHILRHSFATRLVSQTNMSVVQQLLGHKHLSSTQVYLHPTDQDRRDAIDRISKPA